MSDKVFDSMGLFTSIKTHLNPVVAQNVDEIQQQLTVGRLVVIRDAIASDLAEQVYRDLDASEAWGVYEDYSQSGFHYHHHNIYEEAQFPPSLRLCKTIFDSDPTRQFIQALSGRDCSGALSVSASWYIPGDYSTPHNDHTQERQVAFVWHLSKNWQTHWGGDFYWSRTGTVLPPAFNVLLLFNVGRASDHCVIPVTPYARAKRLTVNGWWAGQATNSIRSHEQTQGRRELDPSITIIG